MDILNPSCLAPPCTGATYGLAMKTKILLAMLATLSSVHAQWKPVEGRIMTKWAKDPHMKQVKVEAR